MSKNSESVLDKEMELAEITPDMREEVIGGLYKILRHISSGGMGSIFYGVHILTEQPVAIKMLHPSLIHDPVLRNRFIDEAKALATLEHPNIVELKNFIEEKGKLFLIMQYIEGKSLRDFLDEKGKLSLSESLPIIIQVLEGLSYVHSKNIIHRDIKPSNILINREGIAKLADFGIAKNRLGPRRTESGMTLGTFYYMSPEQITGDELDARSDIYSLGITFFEVLTGTLPFDATSEYEICRKHLYEKLPSVKKYAPNLPSSIDRILRKATEKKPEKRFQSAEEFSRALIEEFGSLIEKLPLTYYRSIAVDPQPKPKSCIRSLFTLGMTLAFLSLLGYTGYHFISERPELKHKMKEILDRAKKYRALFKGEGESLPDEIRAPIPFLYGRGRAEVDYSSRPALWTWDSNDKRLKITRSGSSLVFYAKGEEPLIFCNRTMFSSNFANKYQLKILRVKGKAPVLGFGIKFLNPKELFFLAFPDGLGLSIVKGTREDLLKKKKKSRVLPNLSLSLEIEKGSLKFQSGEEVHKIMFPSNRIGKSYQFCLYLENISELRIQ